MFDHFQDSCVAKSDVELLEWRHRIVANGVQDEFLACLFNAQVIPVVPLLNFVLPHKLLAHCGCITCCKGIGKVCAWIDWYHVGQSWVSNDKPVLTFGDCTCQMAVLMSLFVVMGFRHSEYTAEFVFELVNGLRHDHAVQASQLVAEGY